MSADTALAEAAVPDFHQALDSGQFDQLYEDGADELKQAVQRQDFVALLDAVHRKLGDVSSSTKSGWNVNYHTSGTFVTLTYDTAFSQGKATEQFVFKLSDSKALLVGYHINSNDLVAR